MTRAMTVTINLESGQNLNFNAEKKRSIDPQDGRRAPPAVKIAVVGADTDKDEAGVTVTTVAPRAGLLEASAALPAPEMMMMMMIDEGTAMTEARRGEEIAMAVKGWSVVTDKGESLVSDEGESVVTDKGEKREDAGERSKWQLQE